MSTPSPSPSVESTTAASLATPSLTRRLACIVYELCLLFGVTFLSSYLMLSLLQWRWPLNETRLAVFQLYMLAVLGVYFTFFWKNGGQTLAMKTWNMRVVDRRGGPLTWPRAWMRFASLWWGSVPAGALLLARPNHHAAAGLVFLSCIAFSLFWSRLDKDRQFLHDRIARTRLVIV